MGIIPIINENDTVAVDELDHLTKFGDNDQLSAIVAQLTKAELLIMLSDIDGFYSANPLNDPDAVLYSEINEITPELLEQATGKGSPYGTGGMTSKLKAAQRILDLNSHMLLANDRSTSSSKRPDIKLTECQRKKPPTGSDGQCFRKSYRDDFSC